MNQSLRILSRVRIAAPCNVPWSSMHGDERVRFCDQCEKQVYNFTAMSPEEAALLVIEKEGRLCARMYQRTDGTMLAGNCPVGLQRLRRRTLRLVGQLAACLVFLIGMAVSLGNPWRRTGHGRLQRLAPTTMAAPVLVWAEHLINPPPPPLPPPIAYPGGVAFDPLPPEEMKAAEEELRELQQYDFCVPGMDWKAETRKVLFRPSGRRAR